MLTLPHSITYDLQPYGCVTLSDLTEGSYNGKPTITGHVIAGIERSYLLGHMASKPATGTRTIYGVNQAELDLGHIVRVAM